MRSFFPPRPEVPAGLEIHDKLIHGGFFAALALTGRLGGIGRRALTGRLLGYAVLSELLQAVLPIGRDGNVLDAAADALGVAVGVAAGFVVERVRRR